MMRKARLAIRKVNVALDEKPPYRLFKIRILVRIRRRAATEKASGSVAMIVCHVPEGMRIASPGPTIRRSPSSSISPAPSRMK